MDVWLYLDFLHITLNSCLVKLIYNTITLAPWLLIYDLTIIVGIFSWYRISKVGEYIFISLILSRYDFA